MDSNNIKPTPEQLDRGLHPENRASVQFGISVAIGVLTIILLATTYYLGIFH